MFAPLNLSSNLFRETATVRNGGTEHLGESVGQYALPIRSLFTQLLAQSKRTSPSNKPPEMFAWERLKITVFENGLLPLIRIEQVREHPARTFASANELGNTH